MRRERRAGSASASAGLGTRIQVGGQPSAYAIEVLEAVCAIPAGFVMTYGDVAEYVGAGTGRTVGAVLSRHGHDDVPWHRVIRSTGEPNPAAPVDALRRLVADRTPLTADGTRVDLAAARWDGVAAGGDEGQVAVKPPSAP